MIGGRFGQARPGAVSALFLVRLSRSRTAFISSQLGRFRIQERCVRIGQYASRARRLLSCISLRKLLVVHPAASLIALGNELDDIGFGLTFISTDDPNQTSAPISPFHYSSLSSLNCKELPLRLFRRCIKTHQT